MAHCVFMCMTCFLDSEYMAQGRDGFSPLKDQKYLIDDESGQVTSTVVRKYLLGTSPYSQTTYVMYLHQKLSGAQFINKLARVDKSQTHLHPDTHEIIASERRRQSKQHDKHKAHRQPSNAERSWAKAISYALHSARSTKHYRDHINVSAKEHMSAVDCFDGDSVRKVNHRGEDDNGNEEQEEKQKDRTPSDEDMLVAHPVVDGRLRNVGRE